MEIAASNIVRSVAGRDQGKLFIVLAVEGEYPVSYTHLTLPTIA